MSRADDAGFIQLAWAVSVLQSDPSVDVRRYLNFPKEAETKESNSPHRIFKWEIETLVLLLLTTAKYVTKPGPNRLIDCTQFEAMRHATNLLRALENSEYAALPENNDVLMEMHRIGHRQFAWQRGYATWERLYRFAFIYGQGNCAKYFHARNGLTIAEFLQVSFALFAVLRLWPWTKQPNLGELGIDQMILDRALFLLSRPLNETRVEAKALIDKASAQVPARIAYLPSALRQFPIIRLSEHGTMISPLPELIMFRATAGLYYDLRTGPQHLMAESNEQFELYTRNIIKEFCPRFDLLPSQDYGLKKSSFTTPDVLLLDGGLIAAVIECKAAKLTYEAQFRDNPIVEAANAYTQIIKGITQLWKFFPMLVVAFLISCQLQKMFMACC